MTFIFLMYYFITFNHQAVQKKNNYPHILQWKKREFAKAPTTLLLDLVSIVYVYHILLYIEGLE